MKLISSILLLAFMLMVPLALTAGESETNAKTPKPEAAAQHIPAEYAQSLIPQRNLKFDVSDADRDVPLQLVQNNPPLFEQRYVAIFRLYLPKDKEGQIRMIPFGIRPYQNIFFNGLPQKYDPNVDFQNECLSVFSWLESLQRDLLLPPSLVESSNSLLSNFSGNPSIIFPKEIKPFYYYCRLLTAKGKEEAGNAPAGMAPGTSGGFGAGGMPGGRAMGGMRPPRGGGMPYGYGRPGGRMMGPGGPPTAGAAMGKDETSGTPEGYQVYIFAPSADEAKKSAEDWLKIYDRTLCYSALLQCQKAEDLLKQCDADTNVQLTQVKREGDKISKQLEKYKEFQDLDREAIGSLKTQRRMLAVDLTGVEARLALAGQMLQGQSRDSKRNEQIESIMIAAQIEQVGLKAKCKELDRMIQGMEQRHEILKKSDLYTRNRLHLSNITRSMKGDLDSVEDYQQNFLPLPVHEGKVEIRRIKWAAPTEKK
jgi:hypothetical protein